MHLSEIPQTDVIPPSKVLDLEIELEPNSTTLIAQWTAPGGDYHLGAATRHSFVYSENVIDFLKTFANPKEQASINRTSPSGTVITESFEFPYYDREYFIGIYPYDLRETGVGYPT